MTLQRQDVRAARQSGTPQVRLDAYTRVCLTAIAALLTVLIVGLWADGRFAASEARAEKTEKVPLAVNPYEQRDKMIKVQQETNRRLGEVVEALKGLTKAQGKGDALDALLREQKRTTARLDELTALLRTGRARVRVGADDGPAGGGHEKKTNKK